MGVAVSQVIRRFVESDVAEIAALDASSRSHPWSEGILRDELAAENRAYLVTVDDEGHGLSAFGGVMVVGEEAHVTNLVVAEARRRHGLATRLLLALIDEAASLGADHLTLEVRSDNDAAKGLYAKFGLAPVGVRPDYYGDEDALILWAHDITGSEYQDRLRSLRLQLGDET